MLRLACVLKIQFYIFIISVLLVLFHGLIQAQEDVALITVCFVLKDRQHVLQGHSMNALRDLGAYSPQHGRGAEGGNALNLI